MPPGCSPMVPMETFDLSVSFYIWKQVWCVKLINISANTLVHKYTAI